MYKILVCDDEKWIRKGILAKIQYNNFNFQSVMEAADGAEALQVIRENMPDIVITDVKMPNMGGINLIEKVREEYPDIKFIIVSGYAEFEYVQKAINLGAKGYILKPISDENLVSTLNKVIGELDLDRQAALMKSEGEELRKITKEYMLETAVNEILFSSVSTVPDFNLNTAFKFLPEDPVYILVILNIHSDGIEGAENLKVAKHYVKELLKNIGRNYNTLVVNNLEDVQQLFIILADSSKEKLKRDSEEYVLRASSSAKEILDIQITAAISDVDNKVSSLLSKQAKHAFDLRLVKGNASVVFRYSDICINQLGNYDYPDHKLKALSKCIDDGDLKNVKTILNDIFSDKYSNYLFSLSSECVNMVVKACNKKKMDINSVIPYEVLTGNKMQACSCINEIIEDIYTIIQKVVNIGSEDTYNTKKLVNIAQKYIEAHYSEELTVNALAQRFLINPNYFSNLFSKETGYTITKYITKVRIERACQLLAQTSINIADISTNVGYQDTQYFYRVFKKEMNMTPADYRGDMAVKLKAN